jgi:hypothetical protein
MTNYAGRLWNMPKSKADRWRLRAGIILLASNGFFILVSEGFVFWFGLVVGAVLSFMGLLKTLRAAIDRMDTPLLSLKGIIKFIFKDDSIEILLLIQPLLLVLIQHHDGL